jgi:hypothetical protein
VPNEQRDESHLPGRDKLGVRTDATQVLLPVVDKCDRQALGYPLAVVVHHDGFEAITFSGSHFYGDPVRIAQTRTSRMLDSALIDLWWE